jgi:GWxTD domain-containing protein
MRNLRLLLILVFTALCFGTGYSVLSAPPDEGGDQAEYYKKWMDEDVLYIITDEEKDIFKNLNTDEEKESFIEQFWARRNPDPRSPYNTFKEEHYRRIAYANQHYTSGVPGWRTDRGRVYIMYGKPDQLETHAMGGYYARPTWEGGGSTSTYPFEKWWYRHIDGLGDDIEIEFVDRSMSGEYRLAMNPDEKDALLNVPGAGLTLAEEMGLMDKSDRVAFNPSQMNNPHYPGNYGWRAKDRPFARMEQYFGLQRAPEIKFNDLKAIVTTNITFNTLPFEVRTDYVRLSTEKVLIPITIELNNAELEFKRELDFNRASVNVYGIVTSLTNRIMAEWEDEIVSDFSDEAFEVGKNRRSVYQRIVSLPPGQRYKLDLVLKDIESDSTGTLSLGLNIPKYSDDSKLQTSTVILANSISPAPISVNQLDQFVLGDMKVVPNVRAEYMPGEYLIPYMQIYNMQIDQTSQEPSMDITFVIKKDDKIVEEHPSTPQNSQQFFYGLRVVLLGKLTLDTIEPGKYTLEIRVRDNIANSSISTSTDFTILEQVKEITAANP